MAEPSLPGGAPGGEPFISYAKRFLEQFLEDWGGAKEWPGIVARGVDSATAVEAAAAANLQALWDAFVINWEAFLPYDKSSLAEVLAWALTILTGLPVAPENVVGILDGAIDEQDKTFLGELITKLLRNSLQVPKVAEGYRNRTPGDAEWENMAHMIGAAMRLQLGGAALKLISRRVPSSVAAFLDSLVEVVDKSANLDDAVEEMLQPPMEALVAHGLELYYNRLLKPADLSATEAFHARIADRIDETTLTKILDNAGYRDDIRQILRDFAASNLTESDINDLYQWGLFSREQVKEQYKNKFFEEPERELKTKLVELTRRQKLREKVYELYGNLYRDGVATREEIKPFLDNYGLKPDEQDMWFQIQELERRQRKWLTNAQIDDMLEGGRITLSEARQYQVMQGMTEADATRYYVEVVTQKALQKLPKAVKDECAEILKPEKVLTQLLGELLQLTGLGGVADAKMRELLNCLLQKLGAIP